MIKYIHFKMGRKHGMNRKTDRPDGLEKLVRAYTDSKRKYAEDYEIVTEEDENGREKETIVYQGAMYRPRTWGNEKKKIIWGAVCGGLSCVFLILSQLFVHASSWAPYVALPLAAALIPAAFLCAGLVRLPYKLAPMRRDQYMRGMIRVCRSALAVAILSGIAFAGDFLYRALSGDWMYMGEDIRFLIFAACTAGLAAAALVLIRDVAVDSDTFGLT